MNEVDMLKRTLVLLEEVRHAESLRFTFEYALCEEIKFARHRPWCLRLRCTCGYLNAIGQRVDAQGEMLHDAISALTSVEPR